MTEQQHSTQQQGNPTQEERQRSDETQNTEQQQQQGNPTETYRTQEDFDKAFSARLARERKKWDEEKAEIERKARMDEHERTKAEKEEAEKKAREAGEELNRFRVLSAASTWAVKLGGKPERAERIVQLADLSGVEVGENGPDTAAVEAAIKAVLDEVPELKATQASVGGGGSNPANTQSVEKNPWSREHRNLTEQARITRENPALARQLREQAFQSSPNPKAGRNRVIVTAVGQRDRRSVCGPLGRARIELVR